MGNPYFSFKQFTVYQDRCAMKVGIDGVLLGVWCNVENAGRILDIGTGTGLISLILAQRSSCRIDAIDIDANAVLQASDNVMLSPWPDKVTVREASLQEYAGSTSQRYGLIVSNPPYFVNSLKAPSNERTTARHADSLTHEELVLNSIALLEPHGRICIVLPVKEALQCKDTASKHGLFCTRITKVFPKPGVEMKRLLLEFSLQSKSPEESEIVIEGYERHHYSEEFSLLAKDFYLKL